jgi:hypothetical protein
MNLRARFEGFKADEVSGRSDGHTSVSAARAARVRDESGAVLILALVFLVAVSMLVLAIASWVGNDLAASVSFTNSRSADFAATSATQLAIQSIRKDPLVGAGETLNADPPTFCWAPGPTSVLSGVNGESIAVFCSTAISASTPYIRVVTFSACVNTATLTGATCAAHPLLRTVVTFIDTPVTGSPPPGGACNDTVQTICGTFMIENSSGWSSQIPTVTGLSPPSPSGPISGGTPITVTGTGFVTGAVVNFIDTNQQPYPIVSVANGVVGAGGTSLTVNTPPITVGTKYSITVTTPGGTSVLTGAPTFTYNSVVPTISGINQQVGSSAGGSSITLTGTGYYTGAVVNFVSASNPAVSFAATGVNVISATKVSAVTPAVTATGSYFVTVTTLGGTSTSDPAYTFMGLFPVVGGVAPLSGHVSTATPITLTGIGFVSGSTVAFVKEVGGNDVTPTVSFPATSVSVTSSTVMTAVSPAVTTAGSYFVDVTTPFGVSADYAVYSFTP